MEREGCLLRLWIEGDSADEKKTRVEEEDESFYISGGSIDY